MTAKILPLKSTVIHNIYNGIMINNIGKNLTALVIQGEHITKFLFRFKISTISRIQIEILIDLGETIRVQVV